MHNLAEYDPGRFGSGQINNSVHHGRGGIGDSSQHNNVSGATFLVDMVGAGLLKSLDMIRERPWSDPDVLDGKLNYFHEKDEPLRNNVVATFVVKRRFPVLTWIVQT